MRGDIARVLVVDDFEMVRKMLIKALGELGITQVEEASGGEMALEKLEQASADGEPYDMVFLDWNMPDKTGIEVLSECRRGAYKDLPIVMVTAESEKEQVIFALALGATDYIVKPCNVPVLKEKLALINEALKAG